LRFENFLIRNGAFVDPGAIEEKINIPRGGIQSKDSKKKGSGIRKISSELPRPTTLYGGLSNNHFFIPNNGTDEEASCQRKY
jgi:hypothetical protein